MKRLLATAAVILIAATAWAGVTILPFTIVSVSQPPVLSVTLLVNGEEMHFDLEGNQALWQRFKDNIGKTGAAVDDDVNNDPWKTLDPAGQPTETVEINNEV